MIESSAPGGGCDKLQHAGRAVGGAISVGHADHGGFKRHARFLFRLPVTRRHRAGGFAGQRDINVIDSEYGQLPWGVPLDGNVCAEDVVILLIGSAVRDHGVSAGNIPILQNNNARSLAQGGSEPDRVFSVRKHRSRLADLHIHEIRDAKVLISA